jgi:hypothetical protein
MTTGVSDIIEKKLIKNFKIIKKKTIILDYLSNKIESTFLKSSMAQ